MIDTPRADDNRRKVEIATGHVWLCDYDFACTLEREGVIFLDQATKATTRAAKLDKAARAVVEARHYQGEDGWDRLKNAIAELEGLVTP